MEQSPADLRWLVRITRPGGGVVGAGLVVDDQHVVTCAHVVMAALQIEVGIAERPTGTVTMDFPALGNAKACAKVVGWTPITAEGKGDVAVLKFEGNPPQEAAAPIIRVARGTLDHRITAYGFPGDHGAWATGTLVDHGGPGWEWVQIGSTGPGAPIERGFSGSPVWDLGLGAVVGIIVAQDRRAWVQGNTHTAWMIPTEVLTRAWPQLSDLVHSPLLLDPAFSTHWDPRARGVELAAISGWYFTGRTKVLSELADWLKDSSATDRRARVVIGGRGSGKSAVLARLVTLSDPQYRRIHECHVAAVDQSTMPPEGAIDIAVHAGGKTLDQLVRVIADAADVRADEPLTLVNELLRRAPLTIVIDSIAEAEQPLRVTRELLRPLAEHGPGAGIRLLMGGLRELLGALGAQRDGMRMKVIDLDEPPNLDVTDLSSYVETMLLAEDSSPYRQQPGLARQVATAVATRGTPSFLIAQLVARSLADRQEVIDTTSPRWDEFPRTLDDAVNDAKERYLSRFNYPERRKVLHLLGALAWAEGQGLPSETIWPTVAAALSGDSFSNDDPQWLLDRATGFVVSTETEGGPTYRLFHTALAGCQRRLATWPHELIQNKIAHALLQTVPVKGGRLDWWAAHPYVKAHLVTHALAAAEDPGFDLLDTLLVDPTFLLAADPHRLLRALPKAHASSARLAARAFALTVDYLRTKPLAEWSAYLEFAARRSGAFGLAERIDEEQFDRPWSVRWIRGRAEPANYVIGHHDNSVYAVAIGMLEERPIVVSGGDEGQVRVWDLTGAEPIYEPLIGHRDTVLTVAVGTLKGRAIIISGGRDQRIRVWDLATGDSVGEELHVNGVVYSLAIGTQQGRPVVAAGIGNTVQLWDLDLRRPVLRPSIGHILPVHAVATGTLGDKPIVVSGSRDRTVRVWDLNTGLPIGPPLHGPTDSVNSVAVGRIGHQSVIVSGDDNSAVLIWDLTTIAAERAPTPRKLRGSHTDAVHAVAVGTLEWEPIIVSASRDRTVRMWNLGTGEPIGQPLEQARPIRALALGQHEGHRVIAFGGDDRTVRVWTPPTGTPISDPGAGEKDAVNTVAVGSLGNEPVVVSGANDGTIRLWNLNTGQPFDIAIHSHHGAVNAVAIGTLGGQMVVASGGRDRAIKVWDLGIHRPHTWRPTEQEDAVNAVAIGTLPDGQPVLISGGDDATIRIWDLNTGAPIGGPFIDHTGPVNAVALAALDGRPIVVSGSDDGTVRIWDLVEGTPVGKPLASYAHKIYAVTVGTLDGQPIVAAGGTRSVVNIWDLATRAPLGRPLAGQEGPVNSLAIGTLEGYPALAAGDDTGMVRVWNLADRRKPVIEVDTGFGVRAVAFGAKSMIAVGGSNRLLGMQVRRLIADPLESAN